MAWPPNKFGEFWAPSHPGQRKPQGRLRAFSQHFFCCQKSLGRALGKIWAENPPSCPMVTFGLGGLGGRLLPMDFGNFGPKVTLGKSPNFWWPGGKIWEFGPQTTQAKGNHRENGGGFSPDFPPQGRLRVFKPALSFLPKSMGRALGKIWPESPPVSLWFGWAPPPNGFWEFWS